MNCPRCQVDLKNVYTPKGILVDYCPDCQGIWFDRGELFFYSAAPDKISQALSEGLRGERPSDADCPRCATKLAEGGLLSDDLVIDRCPSCEGIWLDPSELSRLVDAESSLTGKPGMLASLQGSKGALAELGVARPGGDGGADGFDRPKRKPFASGELPRLPNLLVRSIGTFVVLYGLVGALMIVLYETGTIPLEAAVFLTLASIAFNYAVSPFLLDLMVSWAMRGRWVAPEQLPEHLAKFVAEISKREGIRFRWFGIIDDGTPNAFTYGHVPGNARIVITRGLMERLSPAELEAVVAHEIGHAVHWDILVMTMASCVPIILYYIFRITADSMKGGGKKDKDPRAAIMIVSYLAYVIAQYVVLYLSRTREYWADRYAAQATNEPNALSRALVKIAYGLAADDGKPGEAREAVTASRERMRAFAPLGIFDAASARGLVASSLRARSKKVLQGDGENFSSESITGAMQWDLWNPWAMYYELHSTHPLPAKRIEALSQTAEAMKQKPFVVFDNIQPESYWDEFAVDLFIHWLPTLSFLGALGAGIALGLEAKAFGMALLAFSLAYFLNLGFSYPGSDYAPASIASLLKVIKVSRVRPVPAELKGKILGKGVPGYILSEDLTLDDGTGYIFMDYEQPLAIFNWIFGLRNDRYIGSEVVARGWFRRAPVPYFELYQMETFDGVKTCWAPFMKRLTAFGAAAVGFLVLLG